MRGDPPSAYATLPLDLQRHVDRVCEAFEIAWKQGQRPRIEDLLGGVPEQALAPLLCELILLEVTYRRLHHEQPTPEEYQARFPTLDPAWLAREVGKTVPPPAPLGTE